MALKTIHKTFKLQMRSLYPVNEPTDQRIHMVRSVPLDADQSDRATIEV